VLLLAFAVVIVGGMGNLTGTFFSALGLGQVIALTGRFYPAGADTMVFVVMTFVLLKDPIVELLRRLVGKHGIYR